jgi:tRNA(Ile)-lysidine synthase
VLRYILDRKLMRAGDRVAVAVSGGADSVALLRVLLELRNQLGVVLSVAHFNHALRGEASDADESFVAELARQHDLEFFSSRADVRDHALTSKLSLEAAARDLRYRWLASLPESHNLNEVATGHTLDDQAETVLLKFLRGAGTRGLAGIYPEIASGAKQIAQGRKASVPSAEADSFLRTNGLDAGLKARTTRTSLLSATSKAVGSFQSTERGPEGPLYHNPAPDSLQGEEHGAESLLSRNRFQQLRGARIIRPLLGVTRQEIEKYLTALGQTWREDESNLDHRFARNRVRHELLPLLEREYNPNLRQVLSDAAELSRAEEEYWQTLVERELAARQRSKTGIPEGLKPGSEGVGDGTAEEAAEKVRKALSSAEADSVLKTNSSDAGLKARTTRATLSRLEVAPLSHCLPARLSLDNFSELPLALQRRLLKRLLERQQIRADFEHIEQLLHCALGALPKAELAGGWLAVRQGGCLELRASQAEPPCSSYQCTLPVPGEVRITEIGLTVRCIPVPQAFAKEEPPDGLLNPEMLGPELTVRNWRPGDRFWPVHSKSETKLKQLFSEQHIPARLRSSWPVVLSDAQIVWVRGLPVARAFAWNGRGNAVKIELLVST